jgi:hypothetical protein
MDTTHTNPGSPTLSRNPGRSAPLPVDPPQVAAHFERTRWATARTESVDQVFASWSEQPGLVRIFEDPKLGRAELVMLRKDRYDQMVKRLRDLAAGQAGIRVEMDGLAQVGVALKAVVERSEEDPLLESLVGLVANFVGRIESSMAFVDCARPDQSPLADATTLEFLRREDEEEGESNEASEGSAGAGRG